MNEPKKRILVVDDDPDICHSVKVFLEKRGFLVGAARTAEAARELLKVSENTHLMRYSALLVDINLGRNSGIDLLQVIVQEELANCPILMISGQFDAGQVQRVKSLGIAGFIVKPFTGAVLEQKILAAIAEYTLGSQPAKEPTKS